MKLRFIFNPCSGRHRRNARLLPLLRDFIASRRLDATLVATEGPGHATVLAREGVEAGCQRIVAIGGDGTMNEIAQALVRSPAALAMVPCGSGNGLALHLRLARTPLGALELAAGVDGRVAELDTGVVNGHPFFNAMGFGLDAEVAQGFNRLVRRGLPAYAETCPQYLYLSLDNMNGPGFDAAKYVFTPPLREKWHQEKLWQGLTHDTLQVVSTDHCPFCMKEQKELGIDDFTKIPNGGPGIEHRLSLIYTGGVHGNRFSPNRFVEVVATAPAKLFGLFPRKGTIAVGSDADLVIFDPNEQQVISAKTHHMRVDYSMFEGIQIKGVPKTVLSRGRPLIDAGQFVGRPGHGQFLRRQTYAGV